MEKRVKVKVKVKIVHLLDIKLKTKKIMAKRKERKLGQGLSAGTHFEWNRRISTKIHNPKKNTSTKKYYDGSSQRKTP